MLHKNFDHALERLQLFHSGKCYKEADQIGIKSKLYHEKLPFTSLKVIRNTTTVKPESIAGRKEEFKEDAKIGDMFGPSWTTHWFRIEVAVPESWLAADKEVHLLWNGKCEGSIYTDDGKKLLQAVTENVREVYVIKRPGVKDDFKDQTVNLTGQNNKICYLLEMACNEMFGNFQDGFLTPVDMQKEFKLEKCEVALFNRVAYDLRLYFEILKDSAKEFEKSQSDRAHQCLQFANHIMNVCQPPHEEEDQKVALQQIKEFLGSRKNSPCQHQIYAVGHCHIDTAWLWPYAETKRKIARSWASQLELMRHYNDKGFKFCASSAGQYYWLKQEYPEVFARVKQATKEGKFEVVGGTWVEMDGNVPSGEAMVRQFLYGQKFTKEEFGQYSTIFFMPDTFGYSPQLPQIMKQGGIEYFLTQKLSWSAFNKFPHNSFFWRGIDGTEVLTHFPPADTYVSSGSVHDCLKCQTNFKDKGRSNTSLLLFGDGDGGGGPQFEHIERLIRLEDFEGVPKVKLSTCKEFFSNLEQDSKKLMKWEGELYLELHNGTYTTMAENKKYNRECELGLRDAEIILTLAGVLSQQAYTPERERLKDLWRTLLFDQFHDVLPGTCIGLVYEDTRSNARALRQAIPDLIEKALMSLASSKFGQGVQSVQRVRPQFDQIFLENEGQMALVFNTLDCERFESFELKTPHSVVQGNAMVDGFGYTLLDKEFLAKSSESWGASQLQLMEEGENFVVENRFYRVEMGKSGQIVSWKDKRTKNFHREIVKQGSPLNQISLHQNVPFFWDAWDIFHHDFETVKVFLAKGSEVIHKSASKVTIQFLIPISDKSSMTQKVHFYSDTARVDFESTVTWYENRKLLKAYFPFDIRTDFATFDVQNGTIRRPTHANTPWDQAKYEVYGHKFCDVSEAKFGVALLNDCKYGYSIRDGNIGLSLLKASKFPDHNADMGEQYFVYSILPHERPLEESNVFAEAHKLNNPLWVAVLDLQDQEQKQDLQQSFHSQRFIEVDQNNVVVSAFKFAEDSDDIVLRVHEERGEKVMANISISKDLKISSVKQANLLEETDPKSLGSFATFYEFKAQESQLMVEIPAFRIVTFILSQK